MVYLVWFLLIVGRSCGRSESKVQLRNEDLRLANESLKASELEQSKAKEEAGEKQNRCLRVKFLAEI